MRFSLRQILVPFRCIGASSLSAFSGQGASKVLQIPVVGTIEMGLAPFIERSIEEAESSNVEALILDIDTPGGRVDAAERIVDAVYLELQVPVKPFPRLQTANVRAHQL